MQIFSSRRLGFKAVGGSAFAVLLMGLASAHAQVQVTGPQPTYTTNFDNTAVYPAGDSIDSEGETSPVNNWSDSDPNFPDSAGVIPGFSLTGTDQAVEFGGFNSSFPPTTSPAYLSHPFTPAAGGLAFDVDFIVGASATPALQNNTFAFTFRGATGNVFSIDFVPQTGANANSVDAIRYTSYTTAQTASGAAGTQTSTGQGIGLGLRYHLALSVSNASSSMEFAITPEDANTGLANGTPMTFNVALANAGVGVTSFAATYITAPGASPGNNSIFFDNITAVPEPSTYAMLGLGLVGVAVRFRRKARA